MITRRQKNLEKEKLEDDYVAQMRSFRHSEEYFGELRNNSNRFTEELEYRLINLSKEKEVVYSEITPFLSEIYHIRSEFQREMNYFEDWLAENEANYRKNYLQKLDDLDRIPIEED
jgi:hypothetical protein